MYYCTFCVKKNPHSLYLYFAI
uniref:Uncharacterized protein n=1 Tax=Anguilla anguilla TaxID=7936 RepID=A0A0E9QCY2_ANGAN